MTGHHALLPGGSGSRGDPGATSMAVGSEPVARKAVRAALKRSAGEYYEDLDVDLARRAGTALWTLASVYTAAVLATRTIVPAIGWLVAVVLVSGVLATRLRAGRDHPAPISGRDLLWATFGGIALIALAQWLGDGELALTNGLLLAAIFASATQPPRRAALVLVAVGVLAAAPLIYGSMSDERPIAVAAQILLWWGLAILAMLWTARTRALRQQLQLERQRAHELAREDSLTGLGNRRALEEALVHEAARAARSGETVGVLLIDVDRFKSINDRHGHAAGDVMPALRHRRAAPCAPSGRQLLPLGRRRVHRAAAGHGPRGDPRSGCARRRLGRYAASSGRGAAVGEHRLCRAAQRHDGRRGLRGCRRRSARGQGRAARDLILS